MAYMEERENQRDKAVPSYFNELYKARGCSIHHALWKVLGKPLPELFSKTMKIGYGKFLGEYRYSMQGCPNIIDDNITLVTGGIIGVYDKDVVALQRVGGKYYDTTIVGFGEEYARKNRVTVRPPLNITGYQGIAGLRVTEFTDMENTRFYLVYDSTRSPPWRIVGLEEAKATAEHIRRTIEHELAEILGEIQPPVVVSPVSPGTYDLYQVSRKEDDFAYHHARKHASKLLRVHGGALHHKLLVLNNKEWRYVYWSRPVVGEDYLIYFYNYTENTL